MAKWEAPEGVRCDKCELCTIAESIKIEGQGPDDAKIMFVGGPPGVVENAHNAPFRGMYNAEFSSALKAAGERRSAVYVTHVIKCQGPGRKAYLDACREHLNEEILRIKPKAIVTIGALALRGLFGADAKMNKYRGRIKPITIGEFTTKVFPTYDINAILAGDTEKRKSIIRDFKRAVDWADDVLEAFNDEKMKEFEVITCESDKELRSAVDLILERPKIVIDTETRGKDIGTAGFLVTLQVGVSKTEAIVIPVNHPESKLTPAVVKKEVRRLFRQYEGRVIAHNGKFDQEAIWTLTGEIPRLSFDTMVAHNLVTGDSTGNDLKSMTWKYTNFGGYEDEAAPLMEAAEYDTAKASLAPLAKYGGLDTIATYRIANALRREIKEMGERPVYLMAMMASLSTVMSKVEVSGIRVNWDFLTEYEKELKERRAQIEEEIRILAGKEILLTERDLEIEKFSFASNKHLSHLLYKRMGIEATVTTAKGHASVSKAALVTIKHPVAELLREYSGIAQNLKMYVEAYPKWRWKDRIRPQYSLIRFTDTDTGAETGTRSGRFSSNHPNIQQLPKESKGKIRKILLPDDEDSIIGDVDFNQLELRVAAMYCQDSDMVNFFNGDGDYHAFVASELLGIRLDKVTKEQRQIGKALNFSILYGAGPDKIAMMLGVDVERAKGYLEQYFERFPAIMKWKNQVEAFVRKKGYVDTLFGRRRSMPDVYSDDRARQFRALRAAVNHTCQSAGADLCYTAIVNVHKFLTENKLKTRMLFTVHDSVTFSVPLSEVTLIPEIQKTMENSGLDFIEATGVRIKVDAKIGLDFGDLVDYKQGIKELGL